ncbi:hypothetical protein GCM10009106_26210 [Sphingomonas japonica]
MVKLIDQAGRPVPDAVITVKPSAGIPRGPIRFPWGTSIVQQGIAFNPHVLIVPVGATVAFPNKDKVRHHVYSFSKPARFELKLYGRDESHSYTFKTAGAVAIGCNIHDSMSGFIKVVDTPFAAKSAASGVASIAAIPAGPATVTVWHPRLRARGNEMTWTVPISATGDASRQATLQLR